MKNIYPIKVLFSLLLFICTFHNSRSREIDPDKQRTTRKYYEFINYAEKRLGKNNWESARWFYQLAFSYNPNRYQPKDVFNAFVVNYMLNDSFSCRRC